MDSLQVGQEVPVEGEDALPADQGEDTLPAGEENWPLHAGDGEHAPPAGRSHQAVQPQSSLFMSWDHYNELFS